MASPMVQGARAPLFDRFGEPADGASTLLAWQAPHQHGLDYVVSALQASIGRELGRLLNTRCDVPMAELAGRTRSVIDYGLPDYSSLLAASVDDQRRLSQLVHDTIAAFEPRLRAFTVQVERLPNSRHALAVRIEGQVLVRGQLAALQFQLPVNDDRGS